MCLEGIDVLAIRFLGLSADLQSPSAKENSWKLDPQQSQPTWMLARSKVPDVVSSLWVTEGHHCRYQQVTLKVAPVGDPRDCHGLAHEEPPPRHAGGRGQNDEDGGGAGRLQQPRRGRENTTGQEDILLVGFNFWGSLFLTTLKFWMWANLAVTKASFCRVNLACSCSWCVAGPAEEVHHVCQAEVPPQAALDWTRRRWGTYTCTRTRTRTSWNINWCP